MKICQSCKKPKSPSNYHKDQSKSDGLCGRCKLCVKEYRAAYYKDNADKLKADSLRWHYANKDTASEKHRQYYIENADKLREAKKSYYWRDPQSAKDYNREYAKARAKKDPLFRMKLRCRSRVYSAFKRFDTTKASGSFELIGCSPRQLANHLSSMFTKGMTLDNYGDWHIDHITPLASAETIEEVEKLCHYSNLQPLWASDNLRKGSKIEYSEG